MQRKDIIEHAHAKFHVFMLNLGKDLIILLNTLVTRYL